SRLLEVVRQKRVEIARGAEVRELVRVDNRPDAVDFPTSNLECPDRNQPALLIERQRPRSGVDLDDAHRHANALEALEPVQQRARATAAAAQRPRERGDLAATVACQHDVAGEQCLEAGQIADMSGGEELARELVALLLGGLETGAPLQNVASGPS